MFRTAEPTRPQSRWRGSVLARRQVVGFGFGPGGDRAGVAADGFDDGGEVVVDGDGLVDVLAGGGLAGGEVLGGFHVDAGVVFDRRIGVFQLVAGEDADD